MAPKKTTAQTKLAAQYQSRKLWFSVFTMILMLTAGAGVAVAPILSPLYDSLVGGLMGVAGLYMVGNVGAKLADRGKPRAKPQPVEEEPPVEGAQG